MLGKAAGNSTFISNFMACTKRFTRFNQLFRHFGDASRGQRIAAIAKMMVEIKPGTMPKPNKPKSESDTQTLEPSALNQEWV